MSRRGFVRWYWQAECILGRKFWKKFLLCTAPFMEVLVNREVRQACQASCAARGSADSGGAHVGSITRGVIGNIRFLRVVQGFRLNEHGWTWKGILALAIGYFTLILEFSHNNADDACHHDLVFTWWLYAEFTGARYIVDPYQMCRFECTFMLHLWIAYFRESRYTTYDTLAVTEHLALMALLAHVDETGSMVPWRALPVGGADGVITIFISRR